MYDDLTYDDLTCDDLIYDDLICDDNTEWFINRGHRPTGPRDRRTEDG